MGGYCRLQLPSRPALGVRETVTGHRLGALEACIPVPSPPPPPTHADTVHGLHCPVRVLRLAELKIEENAIRSLEGLAVLQALSKLSLVSNRIADPAEIDRIESLELMQEVRRPSTTCQS